MADFVGLAAVATAVFLLAGIAKGTLGIGLPTVSVGLLSQVVPPHTLVALVVFPLLVSNFWQVIRTRAGLATLRRYGFLIGSLVVTLWLTTFLTARISPKLLIGILDPKRRATVARPPRVWQDALYSASRQQAWSDTLRTNTGVTAFHLEA